MLVRRAAEKPRLSLCSSNSICVTLLDTDSVNVVLLQLQGKLDNNPKASALIDKITRTLNTKTDTPTLESLLQTASTDNSSTTTKSGKKRHKKKTHHPTVPQEAVAVQNSNTDQPSLAHHKSQHEDSSVPPGKLSRNQRRKLRKKLKASEAVQENQTAVSQSGESAKVGQKRPCPESPVSTDSKDQQSIKKQRTDGKSEQQPEMRSESKSDEQVPTLLPAPSSEDSEIEWNLEDPVSLGKQELETILAPVSIDDFFK
ncbi:unnamed protein product [Echinostoma caproni]|uniref:E3 ubiquitin-protein ligase TRIP12 n=1 Tax=Echinostoma caproni TaxID=27848 RepID=A0A183A0V8_9TREM|nr:unnamed protein product [Echinostoma caproni]